ncbi:alpha/beta fold hydrolase [Geomonas sp. Red32]|uniref:alpha/beta fold hydrolase n=1 Tax=Geomonas sp. Red32 TaxID=2912856 RepID=UPI00202CC940|nr:alpha/beta fold hydrolase [Geomonas sp. Red32]MCM0082827.1 alpha/beta fold hydrolase [Geomonas sp. Red32]
MPLIELSQATLNYEEIGSGRPIVFVHGWAMSGRVWHFQRELVDCGRLVFLDQRGHGHSATANGYALEDFAGDLAGFFDALQLTDAVLVGWSLGVQVALQAFPKLRDRLSSMVLIGGTPRFTTDEGYPYGQAPNEVKGLGLRLRRDYAKTMGDFFKGMFVEGEMDNARYQRIVHEIVMNGKSPDQGAATEALKILSTADLRMGLSEVDRPVLLVHGEQDAICPASASTFMAQRMPHAPLEIMPGCGHAPFMTQPERFNEIVRTFLRASGEQGS